MGQGGEKFVSVEVVKTALVIAVEVAFIVCEWARACEFVCIYARASANRCVPQCEDLSHSSLNEKRSKAVDVYSGGHFLNTFRDSMDPMNVLVSSVGLLPGFLLDLHLNRCLILEEVKRQRQQMRLDHIDRFHLSTGESCSGCGAWVHRGSWVGRAVISEDLCEHYTMGVNIALAELGNVPVVEREEEHSEMSERKDVYFLAELAWSLDAHHVLQKVLPLAVLRESLCEEV